MPHDENLSYLRDGQQAHVAYNFLLLRCSLALTVGSSTKLADWLREAEQPPERTTLLNFYLVTTASDYDQPKES